MNECTLSDFDDFECSPKIDRHHFISRGRLRGAVSARIYVEQTHDNFFIIPVCNLHNAQTKIADTPKARKYILVNYLIPLWGEEYCRDVLANVPWKVPSAHYDLTFEAIMGVE